MEEGTLLRTVCLALYAYMKAYESSPSIFMVLFFLYASPLLLQVAKLNMLMFT